MAPVNISMKYVQIKLKTKKVIPSQVFLFLIQTILKKNMALIRLDQT
jgi:hypothetical protein